MDMKKIGLAWAAFLALMALPLQAGDGFLGKIYAEEGVAASIRTGARWFPLPEYGDREGWNALLPQDVKERIIARGVSQMDYKFEWVPFTAYLEFNRSGDRNVMQAPMDRNNQAFNLLMYAELAEGKGRFLDRIADGVYFYSSLPSWVLSAHLVRQQGKRPTADREDQLIDLGSGRISAMLAYCHHFFKEELDKLDPCLDRDLCRALDHNILQPFLDEGKEKANWWLGFNEKMVNNWNPWCNSNVLLTFLLVEEDQARLDSAVARSVRSVDLFLDAVKDDGCCEEGPAYYGEAAGKLHDWLQMMHDASGGAFDAFSLPKVRRMAEYESRADIGGGYVANFADAPGTSRCAGDLVWRFGNAVGSEELQEYGLYCMFDKGASRFDIPLGDPHDAFRGMESMRNVRKMKAVTDSLEERAAREGADKMLARLRGRVPATTWYPQTEVAFIRTEDGCFVGMKGGHNEESHNHNDLGNFIFYKNDVPMVLDAGSPTYTRQTFSSERYSIWCMQSQWHNVPHINGTGQKEGRKYAAANTSFTEKGSSRTFRTELQGAYPEEAACTRLERRIRVSERKGGCQVTVTDTYAVSERKAPDNEYLLVKGDVVLKDNTATVTADGQQVTITFSRNLTASVEEKPLDDPRHYNVWGPSLHRIVLRSADDAPLKGSYTYTME